MSEVAYRQHVWLATVFFLASELIGLTQGLVRQGASAEWKKNNERDHNRYEGTGLLRNVGASQPEIISFYGSRDQIDFTKDSEIAVEFYADQAGPYWLTGRELNSTSKSYWMEAKPPTLAVKGLNRFSGWTTAPVLRQEMQPINLAVLVALDAMPGVNVLAPAFVHRVSSPLPDRPDYQVTFKSDVDITQVSLQILKGCGPSATEQLSSIGPLGTQYAGLSFLVPVDVPQTTTQVVTLRLTYRPDSWAEKKLLPHLDYCFLHVPKPSSAR